MNEAILAASVREETGKGVAHRLRLKGQIPAILYGRDNCPIILKASEMEKILSDFGTSQLLKLKLVKGKESSERPVLIKEVQVDPVKGNLLHVDLYEVSMGHKVSLSVPVVLVGQEERVNDGSLLEQFLHEVEVSCLPTAIPNKIEVDVSKLTINQSIALKDVIPPKDVEFLTAPEEIVVSATQPKVRVEENENVETKAEEAPAPEA
ncbi:MAG TPA: 50S ribosomal protein L25 [Bacillota bacterium]